MKKRLQNLLSLNHKRLLVFAMILFIGPGLAFSQGMLTVTTNTDNGDGSLRQTIADAVDGDVINFDAALTSIVLDSSLTLGGKTLTIDGAEAIELQREVTALDSFRIVTIVGDSGKVVTIQNLTIMNGLALNMSGGGLSADHGNGGKTILENLIFKNNKAFDTGGGAYVIGHEVGDSVIFPEVINCQFIENVAESGKNGDGDGGGLHAERTLVKGCLFKDNAAVDDGGGFWIGPKCRTLNCEFIGNTGETGGAVRLQGNRNPRDTIANCLFDGNSSRDDAGAIFSARGIVTGSVFMNNTTVGNGGAVSGNNDTDIYNSKFIGNSTVSAGNWGGAVYLDDDGIVENSVFSNNHSAGVGGAVYMNKKTAALLVGSVLVNNKADSIGGGVYVNNGNVINCTIAKNYAANNGGGLSGGTKWFLANCVIYGNDAEGDHKDIQFIANGYTTHAVNCAIDNKAYDAAAWTATDIVTLSESPFVGGTEADSLMLPASSALIDAGTVESGVGDLLPAKALNGVNRIINGIVDLGPFERLQSFVVTTNADDGEGSLRQTIVDAIDGESIITFADDITTIKVGEPLQIDKGVIIDGGSDVVLDGALTGAAETDIYGVIAITGDSARNVTIKNLTIQNGFAQGAEGGAIMADHSDGGKTMIENVVFKGNQSDKAGGAVSIAGLEGNASAITNCEFTDNKAVGGGDAGAIMASYVDISGCTFTSNEAEDDGGAIFADDGTTIDNSTFTENTCGDVGGAIRIQDESVMLSNSTFTSNSSSDDAGAVMMARGTIINCEFINNSTVGKGGAILANQDECLIENSKFSGNTATTIGGAVYVDDGGVMRNCIIINNTATEDGGGIYMKGDKAPSLLIGSVLANNTANGSGGGVYVLNGYLINCAVVENYAAVNGGALTADGEWAMLNTVVYDNDAVGENKNMEVISHPSDPYLGHCAIDATAFDEAWASSTVSKLESSPFKGGTEADSLHSISSKLIDAGTLGDGVIDLVMETDLDGESRIQGVIDIGPYETVAIGLLSISLDKTLLSINSGETGMLTVTYEPDFASNKEIIWTSSDESIATVEDGIVSGVAAGSAVITATSVDGGFTASCDVAVVTPVTGVTLNETALTLEIGASSTLEATVAPENATEKTVYWLSGDENVATVDVNGVVTAVSAGSASISVLTLDGSFMAICEVTVEEANVAVTGVSLDQSSLDMEAGSSTTLVATVAPADATDNSVSWSSSDDAVATVANGIVTAVGDGSCTITVTTTDGDFTATCDVSVMTSVSGVVLNETSLTLDPGNTATLVATLDPTDATDNSVTWSSSDEAVATVADGVVTAVSSGSAVITVTTTDGGLTATCDVTVTTVGRDQFVTAFRLYPNPVKNKLFVEGHDIHSVEMYSLTGAVVLTVSEDLSNGIDVSGIEPGMYILKIKNDKYSAVKSFMKE